MRASAFFGVLGAMLVGAFLLVWVVVCLAALVFALVERNGSAAGTYALLLAAGLAASLLAGWASRRVARARAARH
ncbi:hypothetical protein GCM10022415_21520 [Knoellia locipacati]|uniref:Uncharacterized protein n=1 Tax=Knoellia locipacati TaxID=882824 RepID=A0A512T1R9_9MICO|nr:hypothetical protein [Knoellia locipacati]GEQ14101.1 hypothetical protein KLO01_21480 [Knoellia locipacati]